MFADDIQFEDVNKGFTQEQCVRAYQLQTLSRAVPNAFFTMYFCCVIFSYYKWEENGQPEDSDKQMELERIRSEIEVQQRRDKLRERAERKQRKQTMTIQDIQILQEANKISKQYKEKNNGGVMNNRQKQIREAASGGIQKGHRSLMSNTTRMTENNLTVDPTETEVQDNEMVNET